MDDSGQLFDRGGVYSPAAPLVRTCRVCEAVTDNPIAPFQRRANEVLNMNAPGSKHQQRFGRRREPLSSTLQNDLANSLC